MLKPNMPNIRSDLSVRLRDIAEKQFAAKLQPIRLLWTQYHATRQNMAENRDMEGVIRVHEGYKLMAQMV